MLEDTSAGFAMNKVLDRIFSIKKERNCSDQSPSEILTTRYLETIKAKNNTLKENERTLIIIPGYSVDNPPRIGHHLYYIDALKYDPKKNPLGYKRIYLFDIYSQKDGRCNFKHSIPELAEELFKSINTNRDSWEFHENGEIDFIGASMGGLIVRKFINDKMKANSLLPTEKWGILRIRNILLVATPNKGCKIIDRLQSPFIQLLLRIMYGKNNFSQSDQFRQISVGNHAVNGKFWALFNKKRSVKNEFLEELNSHPLTPGTNRWITIRGTKQQWFAKTIYRKNIPNDGVVEAEDVILPGAENICDTDLGLNDLWNHRDLYVSKNVSSLMFGLLVLELNLENYLQIAVNYQENFRKPSEEFLEGQPSKSLNVLLKKPISITEQ